MTRFWTIPVLTIYVYVITILAYTGYSSYFGVPSDFVETSIASNTLYMAFLFRSFAAAIPHIGWVQWLILLILLGLFLLCSYIFLFRPLKALSVLLIIPALFFAWKSMDLGRALAQNNTIFYVPASGCITDQESQKKFIDVGFYQGKAVLVPIDDSNKLTEGFLIRDTAQIPCELTLQTVGRVTQ